MATYLQLVQDAATESGTVIAPTTVTGLIGRQAQFARWVQRAWREIQNDREDWVWMDKTFAAALVDGVRSYDPAALGIASFSAWRLTRENDVSAFTIIPTVPSADGEGTVPLLYWPWDRFERDLLRTDRATETGKPTHFTVDPQGNVQLYPVPVDGWTVQGRYQAGPQVLALDADVPEMPARFHDAIMWKALTLMARFDEAGDLLGSYNREYMALHRKMVNAQTPRIQLAGALDA